MATGNMTYIYSSNSVVLTESEFGTLNDEPVKMFTWETGSGFSVTVISYGAIIQSIKIPDKNGVAKDIALGFDNLDSYLSKNTPDLLGAVVGRCVARIAGASFQIDGVTHHLEKNLGPHHLHGGFKGFDKVNWTSTLDGLKVTFSYLSKHGEQGYPGDLMTNVTYEVTSDDSLRVEYTAVTNKKTVVNLSNHSYFNLAGHETGVDGLHDHTVVINADRILEADADWVPTGGFVKVGGTPFDLRTATRLGDVISNGEELRFHHNFCITQHGNKLSQKGKDSDLTFIARVEHPPSGRYLEVYSDQPSMIFYTGNYIQSGGHPDMVGKGGVLYRRSAGLCLETMNMVDAIHHENFPSPILKPGDVYRHRVVYCFGANRDS